LGAAAPVPTQATNHPATEPFEKNQRSNKPVNVSSSSLETEYSPFLDSFLTISRAAGKQEKWKNLSLGGWRRHSLELVSYHHRILRVLNATTAQSTQRM
jgi:hypothetical protein